VERVLDHLIAKCDEFMERAHEEEADDEVFGVIDDLRAEMLAIKSREVGSRLWST
jgi:hypothetical protein